MNGEAGVREFSDGAHDAGTAFGHHMVVFMPKVKDVPDKVEFRGWFVPGEPTSFCGVAHPPHKRTLAFLRLG
jgi:hypothetical protein